MAEATQTLSRRNLFGIGAAATAGAALAAIPTLSTQATVSAIGLPSGSASDPMLPLWTERCRALTDFMLLSNESGRQFKLGNREAAADLEEQASQRLWDAHDFESEIIELEPISAQEWFVQVAIMLDAMEATEKLRWDEGERVVARRLRDFFAAQVPEVVT